MGLHICNNCNLNQICEYRFQNDLMCLSPIKKIKNEQEKRFDKSDFKEFTEFIKDK